MPENLPEELIAAYIEEIYSAEIAAIQDLELQPSTDVMDYIFVQIERLDIPVAN